MADSILFNPVNRWLASGGNIEFFNYGITADPAMSIHPAAPLQAAPDTATPLSFSAPHAAPAPAPAAPASAPAEPAPQPASPSPGHGAETPGHGAETMPPTDITHETGFVTPVLAAPAAAPDATVQPATAVHAPMPHAEAPGAAALAAPPLAADAPHAISEAGVPHLDLAIAEPMAAIPDEAVHDLLGSDPEAGIATLVSLVTVTDLYDMHGAGALPGMSDAPAMLDHLADDLVTVADPLMAETHDAHEAVEGASAAADPIDVPHLLPVEPPPVDPLLHGLG